MKDTKFKFNGSRSHNDKGERTEIFYKLLGSFIHMVAGDSIELEDGRIMTAPYVGLYDIASDPIIMIGAYTAPKGRYKISGSLITEKGVVSRFERYATEKENEILDKASSQNIKVGSQVTKEEIVKSLRQANLQDLANRIEQFGILNY